MPDAVSAPLTTRRLAGAIAAAVLSLWLGFAVVAGVNRPAPSRPSSAPAGQESAPTRLILRAAPALRVRPALLEPAAAASSAPHAATSAPTAPSTAAATAPSTAPVTAGSAPESPPAAPQPTGAGRPAPSSSPAPKPRPSIAAKPKQPTKPDFDESAPGSFDTSG